VCTRAVCLNLCENHYLETFELRNRSDIQDNAVFSGEIGSSHDSQYLSSVFPDVVILVSCFLYQPALYKFCRRIFISTSISDVALIVIRIVEIILNQYTSNSEVRPPIILMSNVLNSEVTRFNAL
jgi:hypothetical protein